MDDRIGAPCLRAPRVLLPPADNAPARPENQGASRRTQSSQGNPLPTGQVRQAQGLA